MRKKNFLIVLIFIWSVSETFASMPVDVIIKGCVKEGMLTNTETDFGTHKVKRDYKIKVIDQNTKKPIDMVFYNNKVVKIKGYLLPGDRLFIDKSSIQVINSCEENKKLNIQEQELLAREIFKKLSETDENDTEIFIENYNRVINECPDTEWAQESYWRLTNIYLQSFDKADYERIVK
ncbi:MAG: rhodopsin, partial [Thermodesulfovibrionales bacterium]|nr:rhodopsin [Thermodesulfovibrionales bacterium]